MILSKRFIWLRVDVNQSDARWMILIGVRGHNLAYYNSQKGADLPNSHRFRATPNNRTGSSQAGTSRITSRTPLTSDFHKMVSSPQSTTTLFATPTSCTIQTRRNQGLLSNVTDE